MIIDAGFSLPACIESRQYRGMPTQAERDELAIIRITGPETCAQPALIGEPIDEVAAAGLARVFKALGDPVRLRLVSLIGARQGGEVCVCDLTSAFDLTQPTISHHLKVLREAGLIDSERRGTWVYYRLVPAALDRMAAMLAVSVSDG
jgi:ArsR family transcriptional regulator